MNGRKRRAAAVSIASNSALIALKVFAGVVTGSIAIITEAIHSGIDLMAAVVAYVSVSKADAPADEDHPYGHAKFENVAAAVEGVLILVGAAVIVFESVRRLDHPPELETIPLGIAVVALSIVVNVLVSAYLHREAQATDSPALAGDAAHLRTDALTSVGVIAGLALVALTDVRELDAITAILLAFVIVAAGVRLINRSTRVLVDEALPADELTAVRAAIEAHPAPEVAGFHKLRARRGGSRRYIDLHVQFVRGTTLESAHAIAHDLQKSIRGAVRGADVLIHIEPESSARREGSDGPLSGG